MSKTLKAEQELEKQYRDYKSQFEVWKTQNIRSIGTPEYNAYVKKFEEWEKGVEKRRKELKKQLQGDDAEREKKEKESKLNEEREAEAAAAYAQSQQTYLAHHQKAMEQAERTMQQQRTRIDTQVDFVKEVMNVVMAGPGSTVNQQPPPQAATSAGPPLALWGNTKTVYDNRDPLFNMWGNRAAPAHVKVECPKQIVPHPYWMLVDTLKEKKMMLAPSMNQPPPPFNANF